MTSPSLFEERDETPEVENAASSLSVPVESTTIAHDASVSLYRKYRPLSFDSDELVGQDHIVRTLRNAVALDRVAHAYLFSGPRGTGKTTTARVLAKAVNCLAEDRARRPCNACANCLAINAGSSPDIIEIDAASNRGIDDIRDLRERVRFAPAQLRSKVYIVDEAHQITGAAANAFLKTLEEPPAHTRFILATTDPEELLPTIVSRCQRFEFRRVGVDEMTRRLRHVAELEGIVVTDDALRAVARHATGSMRDALALLEQLMLQAGPESSQPIDVSDVAALLGLSGNARVEAIVDALSRRHPGDALGVVQSAVDGGDDPRQLNRELVAYLRMLLLIRCGGSAEAETDERARELAATFTVPQLAAHARRFSAIDFTIKHSPYPQLPLEVALVEAALSGETAPGDRQVAPERPSATGDHARPTSLRDRVRGQPQRAPTSPEPSPARAQPATITPFPAPGDDGSTDRTAPAGSIDVNAVADLWPHVRADVKALNRRIEALLSEVDPVAVSGNLITLAVPYPFHRDKLNTDEVRDTVAGVLSRLLQREVTLTCVLRGEFAAAQGPAATATDQSATPVGSPEEDEEERARMRIQAAKNIFDAEELDEVPESPTLATADEA